MSRCIEIRSQTRNAESLSAALSLVAPRQRDLSRLINVRDTHWAAINYGELRVATRIAGDRETARAKSRGHHESAIKRQITLARPPPRPSCIALHLRERLSRGGRARDGDENPRAGARACVYNAPSRYRREESRSAIRFSSNGHHRLIVPESRPVIDSRADELRRTSE